MLGTLINLAGIGLGGIAGVLKWPALSVTNQSRIRIALAVATVFFGLGMTWKGLGNSPSQMAWRLSLAFISLVLGNATGRLLGLQNGSNRMGQRAKTMLAESDPKTRSRSALQIGAILFCLSPLAFLGAWFEGQSGRYQFLVIKAVMDGLAVQSFVAVLGWRILLSAVPVLAVQGSITLLGWHTAALWQSQPHILYSIEAVGGLLIFCMALIILELKRVPLTNYLPSLFFAPLLAWWLGK
jgi:uncharacterized membrane protein YqgA involved in biofilm formation